MRLVILSSIMLAAACSPVEIPRRTLPDVEMPAHFDASSGVVEAPPHWWRAFEDETLDAHVDRALSENLDLMQAWARMAQARAQARIIAGPLLPEIDLASTAARTRADTSGAVVSDSSWAVGFGLSWEIDLWKRIANRSQAAVLVAQASRQDVDQTALVLTGSVTDTWFTIREQAELIRVIHEQIRLSEKLLELVEYRYANGMADALQVYQQRQQLEGVRAQLPPAQSTFETAFNALAVLQGRTPEAQPLLEVESTLPALPPLPRLGTPEALVENRPDLRALRDRLAAADHEVASAVAAMLPTITFSLGYDFQSDSFSDPFTSGLASIGGSLLQPLFDNDRRGAEVDRRKAIVQERIDGFAQGFLVALREIEDALDRERNQIQLLDDIQIQLDIAAKQLQAAQTSYTDGVAEYLDVIQAVQTQQTLQRQQVTAHRALLGYRAALYRALGGTWMYELDPPAPIGKIDAQIATGDPLEESS